MSRQQKPGESRESYVKAAARYARSQYNRLCTDPEYIHGHDSHIVARALELTESRFTDLGTFGVEGLGHLSYLNAGDTYDLTVVNWRGRFIATTYGDIVERTRHFRD